MQYVQEKNTKSSVKIIVSRVPQSSILGPLLFLLFINDSPNCNIMKAIIVGVDTASVFSEKCQ